MKSANNLFLLAQRPLFWIIVADWVKKNLFGHAIKV